MDTPQMPPATPIPQATSPLTSVNISTENDDKSKNLLLIFGAIALGVFILGNMVFTVSNYAQLQNLKKQMQLNNNKQQANI